MRAWRWLFPVIGVYFLAVPLASAGERGKNGSLSLEAHYRRVHASLYRVASEGVAMFNTGQHAAAASFFEASILALEPFLDHRTDLQEMLQKALADAELEPSAFQRGLILGKALVRASDETLEPLPSLPEPRPGADTLWERLGGEKGVTRIIDEFVDAALRNRQINFTRGGKFLQTPEQVKKLKRQMVELASALGKGHLEYSGRSMKEIHKHMGITEAEFEALRVELHFALSGNGVSARDVTLILAAFDSTRPDIVTARGEARPHRDPIPERSLWRELGGEEGVTRIADDLVDLALEDKRVNFSRNGKYLKTPAEVKALKRQIVLLVSTVGKGPPSLAYKGRTMLAAHKGMGITDAEFSAFVEDLVTVLRRNEVKPKTIEVIKEMLESKRGDIVENRQKVSAPAKRKSDPGFGVSLSGAGRLVGHFCLEVALDWPVMAISWAGGRHPLPTGR